MENFNDLYKNYYNVYKSDYDADDELKEDKKKTFGYKQFELGDKIIKESNQMKKMKQFEITVNTDQGTKLTKREKTI